MSASLRELESHCGSWVVTSPDGQVRELYSRHLARMAVDAGWKVETASQYLVRINKAHLSDTERSVVCSDKQR